MPIRVLIADDHKMLAQSLEENLTNQPNQEFEVIGVVHTEKEAVAKAGELKPDVILLDVALPDATEGLDALKKIVKFDWEVRVLIMCGAPREQWVLEADQAGALGFIDKEEDRKALFEAIRVVSKGELWLRGDIFEMLKRAKRRNFHLTPRQQQVLDLMDQGLSDREIAEKLKITEDVVAEHVSNILEKFGEHKRAKALYWARVWGLLPPTTGGQPKS